MNKKIITMVLVCLILITSTIATVYATTNINAIQPDGALIVTTNTPQYTPIIKHENGQIIILPRNEDIVTITTPTPTPVPTSTPTPVPSIDIDTPPTEEIESDDDLEEGLIEQIYKLVNEERKKENLKEVTYNYNIQEKVDLRAQEISDLFSHTRPNGKDWASVLDDVEYLVAGENLAQADNPIATAETFMKAWMESEGHKANILSKDFVSMALGIYETNTTTYIAQIFIG